MDGYVTIGAELDTKGFDKEIVVLEDKLNDIKATLQMADEDKTLFSTREVKEMEAEAQKLGRRIDSLRQKQAQLDNAGFVNMQQSLARVGNSIQGITKKMVKWGLAIFSIRSAYMGIRQAISQVLADDENLKYQIEYIKWSVGQAIKPIVEFIVNLVYKIVGGVGAIIKLLFGINIFSKATASNFKNANSNAKKLKKTLAGFDEMNILNEDGSTGILGSLGNLGDISTEVDTIADKIKRWFTHIPTKDEWQSMVNYMVAPWKKGIDYLKEKVWNPFIDYMKKTAELLKPIWEPMYNELKDVIDNKIKPSWERLKEFISQKTEELRPIWEPVKNAFIQKKNEMLRAYAPFINQIIYGINQIVGIFGIQLKYIDVKVEDTGNGIEENIGGSLEDVKDNAIDLSSQTFKVNIDNSSINNVNNSVSTIWDKLKSLTSKIWNVGVKYTTDQTSVGQTFQALLEPFRRAFGFAKGGIVVPKLASGGVINQPGRGVPLGSAIAGERGAEGVIPLTDSQQMALLGEAIGKYITVDITNVTNLDGRQIARKVDKIKQNDNFVLNR